MSALSPEVPSSVAAWRLHTVEALGRYWTIGAEHVQKCNVHLEEVPAGPLPPPLHFVDLPAWAADLGVAGRLAVPQCCVRTNVVDPMQSVDWLAACHWFLAGLAEREAERLTGPIHSYSFKLEGWDERMWAHAWVNRIALLLRRWLARSADTSEDAMFGPRPSPRIVLTHDVDAVEKTIEIRLKQTAFRVFSAARNAARGRFGEAIASASSAWQFAVYRGSWWFFDLILKRESACQVASRFYFYAGPPGGQRSLRGRLLDPAYDIQEPTLRRQLSALRDAGKGVGLHPSFQSFDDPDTLRTERERLEAALGHPVSQCRQHWLRFSWEKTWAAQAAAGLTEDSTMGFNDRPGFRLGAALRFRPWSPAAGRPADIVALPLVLMDSHLYDYAPVGDEGLDRGIQRWVDEVVFTGGEGAFLWHQQVLGPDYGWLAGFDRLLAHVAPFAADQPN